MPWSDLHLVQVLQVSRIAWAGKKKGKTTTINIHPKKHVITHKHKGKLTSTLQVWNVQYVALQMEYSVK